MTMHCDSLSSGIPLLIANCNLPCTVRQLYTVMPGCRAPSHLIFLSELGSCQTLICPVVLEQVEVRGVEGELREVAQKCITIRPNFSYSLQEVKEDTNRVFSSGYFERLEPTTEDTRDGVKLIFNVRSTAPLLGLS